MRWAECAACVGALLLGGFVHAEAPAYGKVETFQPGKKYNCVPTADHKAWDCSESGKAAQQQARDDAPAAPPSSSSPVPGEPTPKASALPSYLTNSAAGNRPNSPMPAASETPPIAPESRVETKPSPTPKSQSVEPASAPPQSAPASAPPAQPRPVARPTPAPAAAEKAPIPPPPAEPLAAQPVAKPAPAAHLESQASDNEFTSLSGEQYVLELAHADSADLDVPAVPRGKVYKLHLRQNGAERWLLLWGPFDSVESARAARDEIAARGATPGWPRRVAPLQAEARRNSE